jgi:putative membrane protein
MGVKFLASAATAGLLLSATAAVPRAAAQEAALTADSTFIQTAGSLGLLQVKLGKLAEEKGSSPSVRDYGKRMVSDYTKVNEELAAGAKQAAYPEPVMLRQHKQVLDRFTKTGRSSFDKKYMAEMVKQQEEAVDLFKREAEGGRVKSLKALASKTLPEVEQHQTLARQTAGTVGADVTAANARPRQGS